MHTVKSNPIGSCNSLRAWAKMRDPEDPSKFWYGQSYIPADYRLDVRFKGGGLLGLLLPIVLPMVTDESPIPPYKPILGGGSIVPAFTDANAAQIGRQAFPRYQSGPDCPNNDIDHRCDGDWYQGSRKGALRYDPNYNPPKFDPDFGFEADDSDPKWKNRSAFVPLLVAACGTLYMHSQFDPELYNPLVL